METVASVSVSASVASVNQALRSSTNHENRDGGTGTAEPGGLGGQSPPNNFPKFDLKKLNIVILKIMWLHTLLIMQWS